jgi:hypothetical protein
MPPALVWFSYFSGRVSSFCPGLASDFNPLIYGLSCNSDNRSMPPHSWISGWEGLSLTFCPGYLWIVVLLISASQLSEITGTSKLL